MLISATVTNGAKFQPVSGEFQRDGASCDGDVTKGGAQGNVKQRGDFQHER